MNSEVCVDASVVLKWYLPEEFRENAMAMADECFTASIDLIAPDFVFTEASSAVRRAVYRGLMTPIDGMMTVGLIMRTPITRFDARDLWTEAWRLAETYRLATLYDAYYLALSELRGCTFWTADERLLNSVSGLSYVRHIRDFAPGMLDADG